MSDVDLVEAVSVLRDEVLDTVEHGDRDPPGAEVRALFALPRP